ALPADARRRPRLRAPAGVRAHALDPRQGRLEDVQAQASRAERCHLPRAGLPPRGTPELSGAAWMESRHGAGDLQLRRLADGVFIRARAARGCAIRLGEAELDQ